jgi:hypothetical protein
MFRINGKNITLSSSDTLDTLKNKIAAALRTLPALIEEIPNKIIDGGTYTIPDPLFFLDTTDDTMRMRTTLFVEQEDGSVQSSSITWQNIVDLKVDFDYDLLKKFYIISKVQMLINDFGPRNSAQAIQYGFFELQNEFDLDENIWNMRASIINDFKELVEENLKNVKQQSKTVSVWESVTPTFQSTYFIMNKINHQTQIPNLLKKTELMVFDSIKLNNRVVACFYQDMIKFNPDFKHLIDGYLNQDWVLSSKIKASDIVRIMITYNVPNSRIKYKMINIFVREDKITLTIETLIYEPNIGENDSSNADGQKATSNIKNLIKNILYDMGEQTAYDKREEKEFYYGSYSAAVNISLVVLKDLLTNDPNVYNISYINESALINTRKTNLNIFLKGSQSTTDIGVSIFERPDTVGTFIRLKKIYGGSDLKIRIKGLMTIVNKILQYTFERIDMTLKFYQQYINLKIDIEVFEKQVSKDKENMLKLQAPEIFLSNYTRLCNKPPTLLQIGEQVPTDPEKILKFPIYGESDPKLYVCPYSDYKYPGLRENTKLTNKNIFPFVPCCYQRPQLKSKNYKMYYNQEVYEQRINTGEIGKSLKILSPERLGALPPKIDKLLNYSTGIKFYRYGIPGGVASCLNLLNKVTNNQSNEKNIRIELAQRAELCKGELSGLTVKEISKKLLDPTTYINPRYFKGALEDYYQLSYILFSKDKDDFSIYPNRFVKFICPLKKKVIFMLEHEESNHTELIVDEETSTYVNKQGKRPIFTFEKNDAEVKKIFSLYKERFSYTIYDIKNKRFTNPLNKMSNKGEEQSTQLIFQIYPWEYIAANGKILKYIEPLTQYVDSYGQTRLVEFNYNSINFIGQFQPLPCLNLPSKSLQYFNTINRQLLPQQIIDLTQRFPFIELYLSNINISEGYISPYSEYKNKKKLAEYILWAACHAYSVLSSETGISVDDWIVQHTQVIENYRYANVTIGPIFNLDEIMVKNNLGNKFIFNSIELQNRIRYNLSLISPLNLKFYKDNIYHSYFNDVSNFNVEYPAQLALTKQNYFQRTRKPYILNILTTETIQYLRYNTLYFIEELFGHYMSKLCLFLPSLEESLETAEYFIDQKIIVDETLIYVSIFDQDSIKQYSIGDRKSLQDGINKPSLNIIMLNINSNWFYGIILPDLL